MLRDVTVIFEKKNGVVVSSSEKDELLYRSFLKDLPEGKKVEVYLSVVESEEASLGKKARIHAMIRNLASFTGESFDETKKMVKIKAGLYRVSGKSRDEIELLSFGKCSDEQLALAIQTCFEMGLIVGADL